MNAEEIRELIQEILDRHLDDCEDAVKSFNSIRSFEDAGVLSGNAGFVITLTDGSEFQVSVVLSRVGRPIKIDESCPACGCKPGEGYTSGCKQCEATANDLYDRAYGS